MVITITSLRLRRWWHYFLMSYMAMLVTLQIRKQKGFIKMKNTGFGYLHFTLTVWENEEAMKNFAHSGNHLKALKQSRKIATEIRSYTFQSEKIPDWKEVEKLLFEKGKVISFQ